MKAMPETHDVLLDDELTEDELLYHRRRRPIAVRQRRLRSLRGILRVVRWMVGIAAPLGWGVARLVPYLLTSPRFSLAAHDVVVTGNRYVPSEEIIAALQAAPAGHTAVSSANLFALSLKERQQQLEALPWVRSAALARTYPHGLLVHITERVPIAFASIDGRVVLVDGEGVVLEKPAAAAFNFPVLSGLSTTDSTEGRRARMALYQEFLRETSEELPDSGWQISEVDLSDTDDLKALLVRNAETILVHFGHRDFAERLHSFLALLPDMRKAVGKVQSVDLRYRDQVVLNPQEK